MARVFVTGAGGFIGSHVARAFAEAGHEVFALHRGDTPDKLSGRDRLTPISGDLRDPSCFPDAFDLLVHCGAVIPATTGGDNTYETANAKASEDLFAHAVKAGASAILFCSSMSAFGKIEALEVRPDTPTIDADDYGLSKLAGEAALQALCDADPEMSALSIRLPGIVGKGSHNNFLSNVTPKIFAGEPVSGRNPSGLFNNIVHVSDLAAFFVDWAERALSGEVGVKSHRITTIASREPLTIRQVLELLYEAAERPFDVTFDEDGKAAFTIDPVPAMALGFRALTTTESVKKLGQDHCA